MVKFKLFDSSVMIVAFFMDSGSTKVMIVQKARNLVEAW